MMTTKQQWPRLSVSLPGPRAVNRCQSCGGAGEIAEGEIIRWVECDDQDRRTLVVVCLCPLCSDRIIEPHPRLYGEIDPKEAWPGTEAVCGDCPYREGVSCCCPQALGSGGTGIYFGPEKPTYLHLSRVPRSKSRSMWMWAASPTTCTGKPSIPAGAD